MSVVYMSHESMSMCLVCVCVFERGGGVQVYKRDILYVCMCVCVCVYMCERERERESPAESWCTPHPSLPSPLPSPLLSSLLSPLLSHTLSLLLSVPLFSAHPLCP